MFDDVLDIIHEVAPHIASALASPLAGAAVQYICDILGADEATSRDLIHKAHPDTLLALQSIDADFKQTMKKLHIDILDINQQDRASARKRAIATNDITPALLAFSVITMFFGLLFFMMFQPFPHENTQMLNIAIGVLGGVVVQVANYYFGSSKSSSDKNLLLYGKN